MKVNQKDIVIMNVPYSDYMEQKVRPAIIISNADINSSMDCIILPITSIVKDDEYSININQEDLSQGHLLKQSRVRIDKIMTVEQSRIIKKVGEIKDEIFEEIKGKLSNIL